MIYREDFDTQGRKIVFASMFGSHNYNLNTENSDKDYKLFIYPTFDDLYTGKYFSTSVVSPDFDYDIHDIRQLPELFWKTNINFMEVLFAEEIMTFEWEPEYLIEWMLERKEDLARMNLPYLYNACVGMSLQKQKRMMGKGTESTKHLVEKYGYECKEASHAIRVLDFLLRYHNDGFCDFKRAIRYDRDDWMAETLIKVKTGMISLSDTKTMLGFKMSQVEDIKSDYLCCKPNVALKAELDSKIKEYILGAEPCNG